MIYLLLYLCFATNCKLKLLTAMGKRITFDSKNQKKIQSGQNAWVYAYFNDTLNYDQIKAHGINLCSGSLVYKNVYKLYLDPAQISYLKSVAMLDIIRPKDKIYDRTEVSTAKYIYAQGSFENGVPIDSKLFEVLYKTSNSLIVETNKPKETAKYLSHINEVEHIGKYTYPKSTNNMAAGFSQLNSENITLDKFNNLGIPRYLESKGINGKDQVVAFLDLEIDYYHTLFYDSNVTLLFNQNISNHRKFTYFYNEFQNETKYYQVMTKESHGTHVAGIISGKALDEDSKINSYNGIAPESKLMYLGRFENTKNENFFNSDILDKRLYEGKAISFSNSWGYEDAVDYMGTVTEGNIDSIVYYNNSGQSCVYLYAAGNEGSTHPYYSINYPSAGKNVLSVAAADRIFGYSNFNISVLIGNQKIPLYYMSDQPDTSLVQMPNIILLSDVNDFTSAKETEKLLYIGIKETKNIISVLPQILQQIKIYSISGIIFDINKELVEKLSDVLLLFQANFLFTYQDNILLDYVGKKINVNTTYDKIIPLKHIKKVGFSSVGPTLSGIIKPDIMAPGTDIYSANSSTIIDKNHGSNETDFKQHLTIMSGTSMATPNAAGAAALISQYLTDGHYINETVEINSFLLRSLLINSASKNDGTSTPDCYIGHGAINISSILPFNDSDFGLRISKINKMEIGQTHHVGYIAVTSQTTSLRIVLSSVDIPLSLDSFIPIYYDLDLIVKSPNGKIYKGNNHTNDTEHLTLNEKVIIPQSEIVLGQYEIHVITNINIQDDKVRYVISAVGPFEHDNITTNPIYIEMNNTDKCVLSQINNSIRCENGRYVCSENYTGQLCTQYIQNLESFYNHTIITVPPNEIRYFKFSHINDYDKMIITTIALNGWNNNSMIWEMGSPDNYIPALANYGLHIPVINYPMFGPISQLSYYSFDYKNYPIVISEEDHYFMIINNFANQTNFLIYLVNEPYDGPICFCDNNKCSNSNICSKQNTYNDINKLFGLVTYVNNTTTYIDMNVRIPALYLTFANLSLELLNKNGPKHIVELMNISDSGLFESELKLTAKDLTIKLGDEGDADKIDFDYLNLTNVNLIMNDYTLNVYELVIDFESYNETLTATYLTLIDDNIISSIEIYNQEILLKTFGGNSKKVKLEDDMQIDIQTSRPQDSILSVVKGQKGELHLPNGINITIIPTKSDGSNIKVDDSLKNFINISNGNSNNKTLGLSNGVLIGIIVGCIAFVIIVITIIIIVIHNKKKRNLPPTTG